jgi:hypothetical protein
MRSVLDYPIFVPEHHRTVHIFLQLSLHAHRYVIDASTRARESTATAEYVRTENKVRTHRFKKMENQKVCC